MSKLQYSESVISTDVQIWNNAAFDNGDSIDGNTVFSNFESDLKENESPLVLKSVKKHASLKRFDQGDSMEVNTGFSKFESDLKENESSFVRKPCTSVKKPNLKLLDQGDSVFPNFEPDLKENKSSFVLKPCLSVKKQGNMKPLNLNNLVVNSEGRPTKVLIKPGPGEIIDDVKTVRDEKVIDREIEEVQMEISRLSSKLKLLKVEKADQKLIMLEKKGRIVSAKFLDPKNGLKIGENTSSLSAKERLKRRGVSMGPNEILAKSRPVGKVELTPVNSIQNRRTSCFWKLEEIDELKVIKERGKSSSVSPKSRKNIPKTPFSRNAVTTVGAKKCVKKEEVNIQPKKLFLDGEKSGKKTVKPGRAVASRYNQVSSGIRKRSLPENEKDENKRVDKKRASSSSTGSSIGSLTEVGPNKGSEIRTKKRWDVSGEIVVHSSVEDEDNSNNLSALKVPAVLPRIKILRGMNDSPRDSGRAKRVSELIGRKSYFSDDVNEGLEVCHELDFAEDDE